MLNKTIVFCCLVLFVFTRLSSIYSNEKLNIGMNLDSTNYYNQDLIFNDVMMTASEWISFNTNESGLFNTGKSQLIPLNPQGYPVELPFIIDDIPQGVRFLLNNNYKGEFVFLYEGEGKLEFSVPHFKRNGKTYLKLNGEGGNVWISIFKSKKENPIRNIRIIPEENIENPITFHPLYLNGLAPFHCLRFMDWLSTNNSTQTTWDTRSQPYYYSQGTSKGVAIEYAIELCNKLGCDAWFCIPHKADDQYIRNFAQLVLNNLDKKLKVYVEYSNEIWNWQFQQASYVLENAPGAIDSYISKDLASINPDKSDFVLKDAYMMQRVFKIWSDIFGVKDKDRLIRVATVQHAWAGNTDILLSFLFKKDASGKTINSSKYKTSLGLGCDAVAPAAYFSISQESINTLKTMKSEEITPLWIIDAVEKDYPKNEGKWTDQTAAAAKPWKVDYLAYEGGQHLVTFENDENPITKAIWAAQIYPKMYDIYMKCFHHLSSSSINCKLFCAYKYLGGRKTKWGSWGHLENVYQIQDLTNIRTIAPKYAALLDGNTPKDTND